MSRVQIKYIRVLSLFLYFSFSRKNIYPTIKVMVNEMITKEMKNNLQTKR